MNVGEAAVDTVVTKGQSRVVDAEQMRRAFHERNIAKERAEWLYNYDPLTVPLV